MTTSPIEVVVTGMGATTPVGGDVDHVVQPASQLADAFVPQRGLEDRHDGRSRLGCGWARRKRRRRS